MSTKLQHFKRCILFLLPLPLRDILWLLLPCAFHPCHLHLSLFPVCSICSAVDNVLVSFLQDDLRTWGKEENFFFPKSEGVYTSGKETWNNEFLLRTKSLCMLTVLTHDIYLWPPVTMIVKIVEFVLPRDKQVHALVSNISFFFFFNYLQ